MLFNLKEALEHGVSAGTDWDTHHHTTVQFNEPQDDEQ